MLLEDFVDSAEALIKSVLHGSSAPKSLEGFVKKNLEGSGSVPEDVRERFVVFCRYFLGIQRLPEERAEKRLENGLLMIDKIRRENLTALPPEPERKADLETPIKFAKKIGPSREDRLMHLGIFTLRDLFYHFPRLYDDWRRPLRILELRPGERVSAVADIVSVEKHRVKSFKIVQAVITDSFSNMYLTWFNQEYLYETLAKAKRIAFSGIVKRDHGHLQVSSPDFDIVDTESPRITPIYDLTAGISQKIMRSIMEANIPYVSLLEDPIPEGLLSGRKLLGVKRSIYGMHFPKSEYHLKESKKRLAYEEFFLLEISKFMARNNLQSKGGVSKNFERNLSGAFVKSLPFELTGAQKRAVSEIEGDLKRDVTMNRLLHGDVGSGKTVVSEIAALDTIESGFQVALMAPTFVLAKQHYERISSDLSEFGIETGLLTGATPASEKASIKERIADGTMKLIVGTHALIQKDVLFNDLGLVVIDEQHKFGVRQRESLISKGKAVDTLVMTATPIPRTLSMTLYGDLDVTVIDEMPKGRKKPKTLLVNGRKRGEVYDFVKQEIEKKTGVFWIAPLIEESEKTDLKAAAKIYDDFVSGPFSAYRVGLLHGRMSSEEKEKTMEDFLKGRIQLLVSTTVIEVGIDVPHAGVMVIEHPERFGLAQLHQLRGRIGRGGRESFCLLITNGSETDRLRYFSHTFNGFSLAEYDLKLRGPGEFMGTRQHGIPEFKIANLVDDAEILFEARADADELLKNDPDLGSHRPLREEIERRYGEKIKFVEVG